MNIEGIVTLAEEIPPAKGGRWTVRPLIEGRLGLSRDERGGAALFLFGARMSFGSLPRFSRVVHSASVVVEPAGDRLEALRLDAGVSGVGSRALAHIAYELMRRIAADPGIGNDVLLQDCVWALGLLDVDRGVLSPDRQKGLYGELLLLGKLLTVALRHGVPASSVVGLWHGSGPAKRDFAGHGIAIEAKVTERPTRVHHVGSLAQLEPQGHEEVYVFSVGARQDRSAPLKLPACVAEVESRLALPGGGVDHIARGLFSTKLAQYGYRREDAAIYEWESGMLAPHLEPGLFREAGLARVRMSSFKGDKLPTAVVEVMYDLELVGLPLGPADELAVMRRLLAC